MTDIKKVLAYSTVSQLGFMMLALGIGGWIAGLFHLITHAFFKALLFLGSGSVIYGCHHEQEMTKMGGLYPKMKITAITMLAGVLAIAGTPLFCGWYSKDAIINSTFLAHGSIGSYAFTLLIVSAGMTSFYSWRQFLMTFHGRYRGADGVHHHDEHSDEPHGVSADEDHHHIQHELPQLSEVHESPKVMLVPLATTVDVLPAL